MATEKKYAVIGGGELRNKGAQAMSFATICEIKRRFPGLEPVLVSDRDAPLDFVQKVRGQKERKDLPNLAFAVAHSAMTRGTAKSELRALLGGRQGRLAREYADNAALYLDISGFSFSDKWSFEHCLSYLERIDAFARRGVPVYLLPQSFGPFDFPDEQRRMLAEKADEVLSKVRVVFPRESDGERELAALCPGAKLVKSDDLVLQSVDIDRSLVFRSDPPVSTHMPATGAKCVGVVPNAKNYQHGDGRSIDDLYRKMVQELLSRGYTVCLIRHAREDLSICERIKSWFENESRVEMFDEDRYCFEYEGLFARCDFLVASRFHSIVHAYRCGVPCISLGWAVKYRELLGSVGQEDLAFDVTAAGFDESNVVRAIDYVEGHRAFLSKNIQNRVAAARENDVFDVVEEDFRSLVRSNPSEGRR